MRKLRKEGTSLNLYWVWLTAGRQLFTSGFLLIKILICTLLQQSRGYVVWRLGNRYIKRTHSLFLDDLICIINLYNFLYQDIQNYLKFVNETILQASRHINSLGGYHIMNFCIFHNMEKNQLYQIFENGV